jgi:hypothetical protein
MSTKRLAAAKKNTRLENMPVNQVGVSDHGCQLGIAVTTLGTLVDVGATDNRQPIVDNANFGVNVDLRRCQYARRCTVVTRACSVVRTSPRSLPQFRNEKTEIYSSGYQNIISLRICIPMNRTSMPSFLRREKMEFGPLAIVRFWHSKIIRICRVVQWDPKSKRGE